MVHLSYLPHLLSLELLFGDKLYSTIDKLGFRSVVTFNGFLIACIFLVISLIHCQIFCLIFFVLLYHVVYRCISSCSNQILVGLVGGNLSSIPSRLLRFLDLLRKKILCPSNFVILYGLYNVIHIKWLILNRLHLANIICGIEMEFSSRFFAYKIFRNI